MKLCCVRNLLGASVISGRQAGLHLRRCALAHTWLFPAIPTAHAKAQQDSHSTRHAINQGLQCAEQGSQKMLFMFSWAHSLAPCVSCLTPLPWPTACLLKSTTPIAMYECRSQHVIFSCVRDTTYCPAHLTTPTAIRLKQE